MKYIAEELLDALIELEQHSDVAAPWELDLTDGWWESVSDRELLVALRNAAPAILAELKEWRSWRA